MYSKEDDEISIYEVFLIISKRGKLIISIVLVALLLTGVVCYFMKPIFQTTFTVKIPALSEKRLISDITLRLISELDLLIKEKSFKIISSKLNIDEGKVIDLVKLSAYTVQNDDNFVVIVMEVSSTSGTDYFKKGILHFFVQNQYIRDRIALRKEDLISLASDVQTKIQGLENLKNNIVNQIKDGGAKTLGFNPTDMDATIINLRQKLLELKTELKLLRGFEIAAEPSISKKPIRPEIMLYLIMACIASLVLGIFVALVLEWKNVKRI